MVIKQYNWTLVITFNDGNVLRLPFENYAAAEWFAHNEGDHVDRYYIEAIK